MIGRRLLVKCNRETVLIDKKEEKCNSIMVGSYILLSVPTSKSQMGVKINPHIELGLWGYIKY